MARGAALTGGCRGRFRQGAKEAQRRASRRATRQSIMCSREGSSRGFQEMAVDEAILDETLPRRKIPGTGRMVDVDDLADLLLYCHWVTRP